MRCDTATETAEQLIARRVRAGYNEAESRRLLAELFNRHEGDNLDHALAYNGFTQAGDER